MTNERITEEMARLDGYSNVYTDEDGVIGGYILGDRSFMETTPREVPDYPNDHNACQRVIDSLDETDLEIYIDWLIHPQYEPYYALEYAAVMAILKATPRQKCEALLKTKGVWTDDT